MANIIVATIELTVANSDVAALEWAVRVNKELTPAEDWRRERHAARAEFFIQHGRWPTEKEVLEYDKTLEVEPLVKGSLTE